jgi:hypothetical protein
MVAALVVLLFLLSTVFPLPIGQGNETGQIKPTVDKAPVLDKASNPDHRQKEAPPDDQRTGSTCTMPSSSSYLAELQASGTRYSRSVQNGSMILPLEVHDAILSGPDGFWRLQVNEEGKCLVTEVTNTILLQGEVIDEGGSPLSGVSVRAECSRDDWTEVRFESSDGEGTFSLELPWTGRPWPVHCILNTRRGIGSVAWGIELQVNLEQETLPPFFALQAPELPSPLSEDPDLACEESSALMAIFGTILDDTGVRQDPFGADNWMEVDIRRMLVELPDCGVADLSDEQSQAWLDWFNGKGPRPARTE